MEKEKMKSTSINIQTPLLVQSNGTHQNPNHGNNNNSKYSFINHDHYSEKKQSHLKKKKEQNQQQHQQEVSSNNVVVVNVDGESSKKNDPLLEEFLKKLEFYLRILGFDQTNPMNFVLSWVVFFVLGLVVPVSIIELTHCFDCEDYQVKDFEYEILTSHLLLSGVSLICVAYNIINSNGLRGFLFVDQQKGLNVHFKELYIKKIKGFYRLLLQSLIPCVLLKAIHETMRMIYVQNQSWGLATLNASALIISWTYLSLISLAACMLFHLACNLQVVHFNDYAKLLEKESSITDLMDEHMRLRKHLSKISHRFRVYLILIFLLVTASLCMTLVQITGVNGKVTFLNGGNFAVTSIVQVVETLLCLHAGTKISSRAQGIGAVACRWHAVVTCKSVDKISDPPQRTTSVSSISDPIQRTISVSSLPSSSSDNDLCSLNEKSIVIHPPSASVSSYNRRQSFVMYLQSNPGGLTLYGWTVDRSLLSTIFAVELSLVLFVLDAQFKVLFPYLKSSMNKLQLRCFFC